MCRYLPVLILGCLSLNACAQLPAEQELAQLPVVNFGEPVPQGKPYILHFAAGKPIPSEILIDGTLIEKAGKETISVTLNRDIYSYKKWASLDGKHWDDARKIVAIKLDLKVPGYEHPQNGRIHLTVDRVTTQ